MKVNDKVFIRTDLEAYKDYGAAYFSKYMNKYLGKEVTIGEILINGSFIAKQDGWIWVFTSEMIDTVKTGLKATLINYINLSIPNDNVIIFDQWGLLIDSVDGCMFVRKFVGEGEDRSFSHGLKKVDVDKIVELYNKFLGAK